MRLALPFIVAAMIIITMVLSKTYNKRPIVGKSLQLPHFTENGDGTITDNWSKLIWLKNIDCLGEKTWAEALSIGNLLADGICDLTDDSSSESWRAPYKNELQSLLDPGNFSPVLPPKHPFLGIKAGCYWLSETGQDGSVNVNFMYIGHGGVGLGGMNVCSNKYKRRSPAYFYLWPVRGGSDIQME